MVILIIIKIYTNKFPRLEFLRLRKRIKKIIKGFPNAKINSVILTRYTSPIPLVKPVKYALCFECGNSTSQDYKDLKSLSLDLHSLASTDLRKAKIGIDDSFKEVYKKNPTETNWLNEWQIFVNPLGKEPANIDNIDYWSLYPLACKKIIEFFRNQETY